MFRLATCNEFIELRKKYPELVNRFDDKYCWGLKMYGYLTVYDQICKLKPKNVLEVGAGLNLLFFKVFGHELEYWMIDNGSLYPNPTEFREKISLMKGVNFVDGLLGDFSKELPGNYFDMIFSISVLEHTPRKKTELAGDVCRDMYRLLKPGGFSIHTIDITPDNNIGLQFLKSMKKIGFVFNEEPKELDWDVSKKHNQILLEKLDTAYLRYNEKRLKNNIPVDYFHFSTILVMAYKPLK